MGREKLSLIRIVETKVREVNKTKILSYMLPKWRIECNYEEALNGRIWVCWDPNRINLQVVGKGSQVIHC